MLFEDSTVEAIQDLLPAWVVDLFAAVIDLGDPLFLSYSCRWCTG